LRRAQHHDTPVLQRDGQFLLDRVGAQVLQRLLGRQVAQRLRLREQLGAELRVRQFDQRCGALADRLAEQVGDAVLGDHVMHVGARNGGGFARQQRRTDARGRAVIRGRGHAQDRLAPARARGAAQELLLHADAAIELAVELVHAGLARQVNGKGLADGHHLVLRGDGGRVADDVDRLEHEQRVAVESGRTARASPAPC
jgi:hypothetical protein